MLRKKLTAQSLLQLLDEKNIAIELFHHAPLKTVADSKLNFHASEGGEIKNLFLRNKKGQMWLFTLEQEAAFDLKSIAERVGAKRFSFASEQRLFEILGVKPGAVSPFALLNDHDQQVTFYFDASLLQYEFWYAHPLDNTMTVKVKYQDLLSLLQTFGHTAQSIDLYDTTCHTIS